MHDSRMPFNVSYPQRFVGAQLHNALPAGDKPSPKAKLPPAFLDHPSKFPIDFQTNLGTPYVLLDFTLGLPNVVDWSK